MPLERREDYSPAAAWRLPDRWEGSCPRDPSPIKGRKFTVGFENVFAARGIQLRRTQLQMAVRPQATSDRQRALPGGPAAPVHNVDAHGRLPGESASPR
jgi:hypothetical protein